MATIIDHLIVELDLDPKGFDEGKKKSAEAFLKLKQSSEDSSKKVEGGLGKVGEAVAFLSRRLIGLAAAIVGVGALKKMAVDVNSASLSISQLSTVVRTSIQELANWGGAAQRFGSTQEKMFQFLRSMDKEIGEFTLGGRNELSGVIAALNEALPTVGQPQISMQDALGRTKTATQIALEIADAFKKLEGVMPDVRRQALLKKLPGMDPAIQKWMLQGGDAMRAMLKEQENIFKITKQDIEATDKLTDSFGKMRSAVEGLGRAIETKLAKPLKDTLDTITAILSWMMAGREETVAKTRSYFLANPEAMERAEKMFGPKFRENLGIAPADQIPSSAKPQSYTAPQGGYSKSFTGGGSFYDHGQKTSTGENFNPEGYTAAIQQGLRGQVGGVKAGSPEVWADVTDPKTGRKVRVKINDVGPLAPGRVIDLSRAGMRTLDPSLQKGVLPGLRVDILPPAPSGQPYVGGPLTPSAGLAPNVNMRRQTDKKDPWSPDFGGVPWLSNPRLMRAPRFNQSFNSSASYSTAETVVHSLIVNGTGAAPSDSAYGLKDVALSSLDLGSFVHQVNEGPV